MAAVRKVSSSRKEKSNRFLVMNVEDFLKKKVDSSYAMSFGYTLRDVGNARQDFPYALKVYKDIQAVKDAKWRRIVMAGGDIEVTKNEVLDGWCMSFPDGSAETITEARLFTMMLLEMQDTGHYLK